MFLITRPRPKRPGAVLNPPGFVLLFVLLLLLVGAFMEFSELTSGGLYDCCGFCLPGQSVPTVMVFMVLVLLGRSVPPQVDSDKLRNELHS